MSLDFLCIHDMCRSREQPPEEANNDDVGTNLGKALVLTSMHPANNFHYGIFTNRFFYAVFQYAVFRFLRCRVQECI